MSLDFLSVFSIFDINNNNQTSRNENSFNNRGFFLFNYFTCVTKILVNANFFYSF